MEKKVNIVLNEVTMSVRPFYEAFKKNSAYPENLFVTSHEAEQLAVGEQFYIIPLFSMKNVNLIRSGVEGITQNPATGALEYRYAGYAE